MNSKKKKQLQIYIMSNRKLFQSHTETQIIINYLTSPFIIGEEQATFWHQVSGQ